MTMGSHPPSKGAKFVSIHGKLKIHWLPLGRCLPRNLSSSTPKTEKKKTTEFAGGHRTCRQGAFWDNGL